MCIRDRVARAVQQRDVVCRDRSATVGCRGAQVTLADETAPVAAPMTGAPGTVADAPLHGVGSSGPTLGPMADWVVAPSPKRRNGRCQKSNGTSMSPGLTFSGKMYSKTGAKY